MSTDVNDRWLVLLGSLMACAAGLFVYSLGRSRLLYDLHTIPGPAGRPLLGNIWEMIGSKSLHLHQVSEGSLSPGGRHAPSFATLQ